MRALVGSLTSLLSVRWHYCIDGNSQQRSILDRQQWCCISENVTMLNSYSELLQEIDCILVLM